MKKCLMRISIIVVSVSIVASFSLLGCKVKPETITETVEGTEEIEAEETVEEEVKLIPDVDDIVINGYVNPPPDAVGPEGHPATLPKDVFLGDYSIVDYINMAKANEIDASAEIVSKTKDMTVAIVMHGLDEDWPRLQVEGIKALLEGFGVEILSIVSGEWDVTKQTEAIETIIQLNPDVVLSIPVDQSVQGPIYRELVDAGIKLVLIDNMIPGDLKHDDGDYVSATASTSEGIGIAAADIMANCFKNIGKIEARVGVMRLNFLHEITEERALGFEHRCAEYYPWIDTSLKVDFDFATGAYVPAEGTLTANPDLDGFFAVWEGPALAISEAARAAGIDPTEFVITTSDLSEGAALEIATDQYIKGLAADDPFGHGVSEAVTAIKAFLGEETPAFVCMPVIAITKDNLLDSYEWIMLRETPSELEEFLK